MILLLPNMPHLRQALKSLPLAVRVSTPPVRLHPARHRECDVILTA